MDGGYLAKWQRRSCLPDCQIKHNHTDAPVNRACEYEPPGVPLSMHQLVPGDGNEGPRFVTVNATVVWEQREIEPHIDLSMPSNVESLTLDEAHSLSCLLARLVQESGEAVAAQRKEWPT